jgi:hypothetical protein
VRKVVRRVTRGADTRGRIRGCGLWLAVGISIRLSGEVYDINSGVETETRGGAGEGGEGTGDRYSVSFCRV